MGQLSMEEKLDDVMSHYMKIREALTGLTDIVNLNFREKDFYYQAAVDNLKAFHDNVIEVLKSSFTPREIRIRLRELEFDEKEAEKVFPL
ncbi:MAG: hypothetical protein ACFE9S_19290 [Candidatus Hermodarchaeota archaeon]